MIGINIETLPITLKVTKCVRCGKTHKIKFYRINSDMFENYYIGLCRKTDEPVVMKFTEDIKDDKCTES